MTPFLNSFIVDAQIAFGRLGPMAHPAPLASTSFKKSSSTVDRSEAALLRPPAATTTY